jgi:hypothetical protein
MSEYANLAVVVPKILDGMDPFVPIETVTGEALSGRNVVLHILKPYGLGKSNNHY